MAIFSSLIGGEGKVFEYLLAHALENIEFHSAWLRGMLGERMCEMLNLDK